MHDNELSMFKTMISCSQRYLEFGASGSTLLACDLVETAVISVDSSLEWLDKVRSACVPAQTAKLRTICVDIGLTGDWGTPMDEGRINDWPKYHTMIWDDDVALSADTVFVDGRFRVACALQAFLHLPGDTVVILHDFAERPHYHAVLDFGREVARSGQLSAFVRRRGFSQMVCRQALATYSVDSR